MLTSEALNDAADRIEERGWTRGNCGMQTDGPLCLEGAIGAAYGVPTMANAQKIVETDAEVGAQCYMYAAVEDSAAYVAVQAYLAERSSDDLWVWNDDGSRTQAQVIEVLRAAAVVEAAKETASTPALVTT